MHAHYTSRMIMSSHAGLTFMYRVGGIVIHENRLLVEWNLAGSFCFVPGGRVEYGETAPARRCSGRHARSWASR